MEKKVILSGIQATGNLTLGNYIGALKNFVKMQDEYDCYYMIANLHALTVRRDAEELRENTLKIIATYIAAGIDPDKSCIFLQSQVPEHAELSWVLNCYTYMGELNRMTQFKDKSEKHADNINSGLFTYPVLMAADILLYNPDLVPTGQDQKQHLEITRNIAERFNKIYGETFVVPNPYIPKVGARIMGLQDPTSKMSKSCENPNDSIFLIDTPEQIVKKIKKAVTDSEGVVRFDIEKEFEGQNYGEFKQKVADSIIKALESFHKKYNELMENPKYLEEICEKGAKKAKEIASKTLKEVYHKIGIIR